MEPDNKPPVNLYKKMLLISEEMGRLPKSGFNAFHKYNYVTEADAMDKFRGLCIRHGVLVIPDTKSWGRDIELTSVEVLYTIFDTETGQSIQCMVPGQGQDKGDKGIYKALTGSFKYFILKTFLVPTGDDPERDDQSLKTGFKDSKGAILIEAETNSIPKGEHPVDKLGKLDAKQKEVYNAVTDRLIELCGTNGKLMESTLQMTSEWRDKETNQVKEQGAKTPLELRYSKRGKAPKSQAEFVLDNLERLSKETLLNAVEVWESQD